MPLPNLSKDNDGVGRLDLGLDALSLFSIVFAIHVIFDALASPGELMFLRHVGALHFAERVTLVTLAFACLARPRPIGLLLALMAIRLVDYCVKAPVASNNATLSSFAAAALIISALYLLCVDRKIGRDRLTQAFAPVARDLLLIMYFYGVFHKINSDFLNPSVSCAVAVYKPLASPLHLQNWTFGQYGAIWATFVVESLALFFLLSRRWKFWGLAIGMPFHLVIGLSGYAFYMDFSLICLSLYTLFLPPEYFRRINQALRRRSIELRERLPGLPVSNLLKLMPILLFVLTLAVGRFAVSPPYSPAYAMPLFAIVGGGFYASVLYFCPLTNAGGSTPSFKYLNPIFMLLALLFLVNGLSPYVGFKTESSINMYSNLRTEGGRTNHLLLRSLPYLFSYQRHLLTIRSSDAPGLQQYIGPNRQIVEYDLDRLLANEPNTKLQFAKDGRLFDQVDRADNQYLATSWLLRKILIFKPVDWTEPKPCTH